MGEGFPYEGGEGGLVDVFQASDVEAALARLVLAEGLQEGRVPLEAGHEVEHHRGLAGREARQEPVSAAAARLLVGRRPKPTMLPPHIRGCAFVIFFIRPRTAKASLRRRSSAIPFRNAATLASLG